MPKGYAILLCLLTLVLSTVLGASAGYFVASRSVVATQSQPNPNIDNSNKGPSNETQIVPNAQGYTVADIARKCTKSVVSITIEDVNKDYNGGSAYSKTAISHGTGVIIRDNGLIVTCHHVVEGAEKITVALDDQTEYPATIVGYDDRFDLAVIKAEATDLPAIELGDSSAINSGEEIVVIGNPLGEFGSSVTAGVLSAPERELTIEGTPLRLMQMDAAVNPGNSGGALLNMQGQLIGIVNAKISASGIEGIAFAIPWNSISERVESIINSGNTGKKPVLGVSTQTAVCYLNDEKIECVKIVSVHSGSAAEKAGLKEEDFLLSIDGKALKKNDDLVLSIKYHNPGDKVVFRAVRNGEEIEITVVLNES